jgi:hypothetical protein
VRTQQKERVRLRVFGRPDDKPISPFEMSDTDEGDDPDLTPSELFALQKGREFLTSLDTALDPFELFYCPTHSLPPPVQLQLRAICFTRAEMKFPPELAEQANAVFRDFLVFTRWEKSFERGHRLQDDSPSHRLHIEEGWPLRRLPMKQIRHVIESFCCG